MSGWWGDTLDGMWGAPNWYVGIPWMECGGHLADKGTLAGMRSSLIRVGVPWLLCGVTLPGVGGTLGGVGGMLVGVKVPWLEQGHPGWCVQLPGLSVGGCPGCYGGETLCLVCGGHPDCMPVPSSHKGRQSWFRGRAVFCPRKGHFCGDGWMQARTSPW